MHKRPVFNDKYSPPVIKIPKRFQRHILSNISEYDSLSNENKNETINTNYISIKLHKDII